MSTELRTSDTSSKFPPSSPDPEAKGRKSPHEPPPVSPTYAAPESNNRNSPSVIPPTSPTFPAVPSPRLPPHTHHNGHFQSFIHSAAEASNPALRHLGSHSTLGSLHRHGSRHSNGTSDIRSFRTRKSGSRPLSSTFEEQRVMPKPGFSLTQNTKEWSPAVPAAGAQSLLSIPSMRESSSSLQWNGGAGRHSRASSNNYSDAPLIRAGNHSRTASGYDSYYSRPSNMPAGSNVDMESDVPEEEVPAKVEEENKDENVYPGPLGLSILITGLCLSVFLISLDRTIITTAIPFITSEFHSTDDIGWYGSSYLLTASAFQPLYGRIFMLFNMKWSYLFSIGMFLLGSLICGIAPNSITLIIGRAISGLGSAGILTGSFVVVSHAVPLQKRPIFTAVVGLMFGVGATVGPLLGGAFTDLVTWRWCFYFNLPVGGATIASMLFFFHPPKKHAMMDKSFFYRVMELDIIGNVLLLSASTMLFLALQYTEQQVAWGSAEVIGLLVGAGLTFITFCVWQWWKADGALMPPRILGQRTVAASCAVAFFIYSAILIHTYYLPIWFQAVRGDSAVHSGVNMIPYVVANALFSLIAGIFVSKNGYFNIPAIVGCAIGTIGSGFISTFDPTTSSAKWIGYEILASVGIGMAIQQGFTAIQIVLPLDEVAIGTAAVVAFQSLGGAIFVSVGNTILQNSLLSASHSNRLPGVDIQAVLNAGATSFRKVVTAEQLPALIDIYSGALRKVFIAVIPMIGLAFVSCFFLEWRSVRDKKRLEDEEAYKKIQARKEKERMVVDAHRNGDSKTLNGLSVSNSEGN